MKINIEDSIYPKQLKELKQPPQVLYVKGNIELLKTNRNINNRNHRRSKEWNRSIFVSNIELNNGINAQSNYPPSSVRV